jgi:hypothetical protein
LAASLACAKRGKGGRRGKEKKKEKFPHLTLPKTLKSRQSTISLIKNLLLHLLSHRHCHQTQTPAQTKIFLFIEYL